MARFTLFLMMLLKWLLMLLLLLRLVPEMAACIIVEVYHVEIVYFALGVVVDS
jgi:hypothetical protein